MDNFTQQNESLMRYLDGEMSQTEREEFEKKLTSDENLRRQLEDLQTARDAIKMYGLKQQVASVHRELMEETKPGAVIRKMSSTRRFARYSLRVAASIVFIGVCLLAYRFFSLSPDKLYSEKYNSFELSTLRGENENQATEIEKAYRQKNYKDVLALSAKYPEKNIKDEFLAGISCLELNKPSEAVDLFNKVIIRDQNSDHPVYKDDAEYYLALSYLRAKNYEKALELMNAIHENPSHLYREKFTKGFIRKVKILNWR
jgi:tetratricopeptide (TPR) repeat protein